MHDQLVSKATLLAASVWTLAVVLMLSGWGVMLTRPGAWRWAGMLTGASLMTTGVAMTLHFRCYVLRLISLIRVVHGLTGESAGRELHPIP